MKGVRKEALSGGPFLREGQIMRYCSFVRAPIYLLKNARFTPEYRKVLRVYVVPPLGAHIKD